MATYIYETVNAPHQRFEVRQSMNDTPLTTHPETGEPVRRVISGGFGYLSKGGGAAPAPAPGPRGGSCGASCGCH